jgi:transglutaminase-like putative cysteine protease
MTTYRITHSTEYRYESEVSSSYGEVHLLPRDLPHQQTLSRSLSILPAPHDLRPRSDYFGNRASFFTILVPHVQLTVTATSVVAVQPHAESVPLIGDGAWEVARDALRAGDDPAAVDAVEFSLDSPLVAGAPALAALAATSFTPGRPLLGAIAALAAHIHTEFEYDTEATDVGTPLAEALERRAGVCQDFAHVLIGALRSIGLAARYVSGYLETDPPPGEERLTGADASHAWVSVWVPEAGWVDVDPTNDRFATDRYITTGWGRDYQDVAPVKGVIFTTGTTHELDVAVDVTRVD